MKKSLIIRIDDSIKKWILQNRIKFLMIMCSLAFLITYTYFSLIGSGFKQSFPWGLMMSIIFIIVDYTSH